MLRAAAVKIAYVIFDSLSVVNSSISDISFKIKAYIAKILPPVTTSIIFWPVNCVVRRSLP